MKRLTKLEIIKIVVDHISKNGRSLGSTGMCEYTSTDSKGKTNHCAVGLFMDKESMVVISRDLMHYQGSISDIYLQFDDLESIFITKAKGHGVMFWEVLQSLHDDSLYWVPSIQNGFKLKLSTEGKKFLKELRAKYKQQ